MNRIAPAQAKLGNAAKTLREKWQHAEGYWKDKVRTEFEEKYLEELEEQLRSTLNAMDRLAEAMDRAERECT